MTRLLTLACLAAVLCAGAPALAQVGPIASVNWYTIDGGGGVSTGESFKVSGTIGQPDAGAMGGGGYEITGGFWPGALPTCYADCNNSGTLTIADFACFQTKFVAQCP
jgi:hypothetical protein